MNDQLESRLRRDLSTVDDEMVRDPASVAASARQAGAQLRARRRIAVGVTSAVVALVAGGIVWASRPESNDVVTSPGNSAGSSEVPQGSLAPTSTLASAPTEPAPNPPPETTAPPVSMTGPIAANPRGAMYDPTVVWTGSEAIVLEGVGPTGEVVGGASAFDPLRNTWREIAEPRGWDSRRSPLALSAGSEVIVLGGDVDGRDDFPYGELYDTRRDEWLPMAGQPGLDVTAVSPYAWTGSELLVWPARDAFETALPAAHSPTTDTWRRLPAPPIARRQDAATVWTGTEWIIWGGNDGTTDYADGAAYKPATDTWRVLAPSPLSPRRVRAVWTGSEMLVFAGSSGDLTTPFALSDGAAYDPATDTWRSLTSGPAHPGFVPIWTGTHLLMFAKGGVSVYDLAADQWLDCCARDVFDVQGGTPVWTGSQVLVIGGDDPERGGVLFDPAL